MKKKENQTNKTEMRELSKTELSQINGGMTSCATSRNYVKPQYMRCYILQAR